MTREQLLMYGKCCGLGCKMCPYLPKHTRDSVTTLQNVDDEPVSLLEYYGLKVRMINALESERYYKIGDLQRLTNCSSINGLGSSGLRQVGIALASLLRGDKQIVLEWDNTD